MNLSNPDFKIVNFRIKLWSYNLETLKQACNKVEEISAPGSIKGQFHCQNEHVVGVF